VATLHSPGKKSVVFSESYIIGKIYDISKAAGDSTDECEFGKNEVAEYRAYLRNETNDFSPNSYVKYRI
jgi:hypothetical protein